MDAPREARIWGGRGSLPASVNTTDIRGKLAFALEQALARGLRPGDDLEAFLDTLPFWARGTYGTNTPCVQISGGLEYMVCDAGSGLRDLGNRIMKSGPGPHRINLFISHPHWDHLQGFPFFVPAYVPGNSITVYGAHEHLERAFATQQSAPFFPVDFKSLASHIRFQPIRPGDVLDIGGFRVTTLRQDHPGDSYAYRFEREGHCVVYATDTEQDLSADMEDSPYLPFVRGADLLLFDSQYTYAEASSIRAGWGHSSNIVAVELAKRAQVKHLCMFHLDPAIKDPDLDAYLADTLRYVQVFTPEAPLTVSMAQDGLAIPF
jgi:phosphoribosyl 1,2-cyclic phosphodiesterase